MTLPAFIVFGGLLLAAAASDLARYRIPNALTAALALAGLAVLAPQPAGAWISHGLALALVGTAGVGLYLVRALGGGDVKLLAAAALWMPLASLPAFLLALALAGGAQAAATLAWRRTAPGAAVGARVRMPYGVSIAVASLAWALLQRGTP